MKRPLLITVLVFIVAAIVWFVGQLFFINTDIVVSKQTTWLTEPLADDGLPDYAAYLLEQGREGVTPENNGAVPFLQAMWPAELELRHRRPLCDHLGMELPDNRGIGTASSDRELQEQVLAWLKEKYPDTAAREEEMFGLGEELEEEVEAKAPLDAETDESREPAEGEPEIDMPGSGESQESGEEAVADNPHGAGLVDEGDGEVVLDEFEEAEQPTLEELVEWLLDELPRHPWRREECPPLAEWIDRHAAHYDLLHEAARRPRFYCPSPSLLTDPDDSLINMMLPVVQTMRYGARALTMRAFLHLGEGDAAGAWRDCEAVYRLGRHVPGETIVGQLVGIAIEESANRVVLALLDSPHLTPEVAGEILAWLKQRPPRASMVYSIDHGERLQFITSMLVYSGKREQSVNLQDDILIEELSAANKISIDWNVVLEKGNMWYDKLVAAAKLEDWDQRRQELHRFDVEVNTLHQGIVNKIPAAIFSRSARSRAVADVMLSLYLPAITAAFNAEDRVNSYAQLHLVAAALAVHRLGEGEYPESLDPLVPGLLDALPVDIHGQPLVYRRTDSGYLLYSLGPNGTDEQGSHEMYSRFKGYQLDESNEAAIRVTLGMPPFNDDAVEFGVFQDEELSDPANFSLEGQIPPGADDWGLQLPLPKIAPPHSSLAPPGE